MPGEQRKRQIALDALSWALLCCLGFWVIYRFANGTSPLRPDEYVWDSGLFQAVGKLWADGLCPYLDIFDHKGPLLFLIQKTAYLFSNPRVALYVIESSFVSVSLILCYQCLRLRCPSWVSLCGSVVAMVFWLPLMEYGNLCETYSMPFLMLALWLQLSYLSSGQRTHPAWYALLYGLCFGAIAMIRPNNGVLIAVITLIITISLMIRRQWKNILCNALMLITGVAAAILPFLLYFAARDSWNEFVYATWIFNLLYAQSLEFVLDWQSIRSILFFITPSLLCIMLGLACCIQKRWLLASANVFAAVATLFITMSGVGYSHYFMSHVPLIPLALYTASVLGQNKSWRWASAVVCLAFAVLTFRTTLPIAVQNYVAAPTEQEAAAEQEYDGLIAEICRAVPEDEHNLIAFCGFSVADVEFVLKTDIHPVGRFCFLMDWHARAESWIRTYFLTTLEEGEAKWAIVRMDNVSRDVLETVEACFDHVSTHAALGVEYRLYHLR